MITLLLGGARSGKSSLAVALGRRHHGPVAYLATSPRIEGDADLDERIARHRAERPAGWTTVEEELELATAVDGAPSDALLIIDCLTVWVGNLLHHRRSDPDVLDATDELVERLARRGSPSVVISNEVGLGIVPATDLARGYRDLLGRVNQRIAAAADRSLLLVAGRAVELRDPWEVLP